MGFYKGIEVADGLHGLIRHMGDVEEYRETLQKLQGVWDNLTLLGQLSGTGTDMSGTRQRGGLRIRTEGQGGLTRRTLSPRHSNFRLD